MKALGNLFSNSMALKLKYNLETQTFLLISRKAALNKWDILNIQLMVDSKHLKINYNRAAILSTKEENLPNQTMTTMMMLA
jgi:hypothetical protein